MKSKILWLLVSCLLVAGLVLASCAPAVVEEEEEVVTPVVEEEEEEVVEEEVAPTEKGPQYGGTLVALSSRLAPKAASVGDTAKCAWQQEELTNYYMEHLCIGDIQKGPRGTNEYAFSESTNIPYAHIKGALAESWEWTEPGIQIFHIRQGVRWMDKPGVMSARELTAEDCAFALSRTFFEGTRPHTYRDSIKSITAPDKYTLKIEYQLDFYGDWGYLVGWGYYGQIYPPEMVEAGAANWRNACGTGPFMVTDYVPDSSYTFERNPNWWNKAIVDGKEYQVPFVDKVIYPIIKDLSTQIAALRTAKVDWAVFIAAEYTESLAETNPELQRWPLLYSGALNVGMRCDLEPYSDKRVRRAMSMAIDRQAFIDTIYGGAGEFLSWSFYSGWPETLYTPVDKLPESTRELFEYNPEKAKQLLAEAGYPDGFKTNVVLPSIPAEMDAMAFCADYWAKIGVECELIVKDYASYTSFVLGKKHDQMGEYSNTCSTPLGGILKKTQVGHPHNLACWEDAEFLELYFQAAEEPDLVKRDKSLKAMHIRFLDECPYVVLPSQYFYNYAHPWVKNYYGENSLGAWGRGHIIAEIWIDKELKK
ncbi:hypothetical protein ES703_27355 [subsurface metagenome]